VLNPRNVLAPAWEWVGAMPPPAPYVFPNLSRAAFNFLHRQIKITKRS